MRALRRFLFVIALIAWVVSVFTLVIPLFYWVLAGKNYFMLDDEFNKILDEKDLPK